ncbi:MAG: DUF434 domain-containing protein [Spirochaetes bacterium]|nr:DUF434 domain-containing protein [Spirochaetota bacterium]
MEKKKVRRGYVASDGRDFSPEQMPLLKKALAEIAWLLDRGYSIKSAVVFVANHYLFTERQRAALMRAAASGEDVKRRVEKELAGCEGKKVNIDGFNILITLEVALAGSTLISCMDGAVRDLAGLRGTYRLIDKTDAAILLLGKRLKEMGAAQAAFYLDAPVSNSGRLSARIRHLLCEYGFGLSVETVASPDALLKNLPCVVSSDAIILNDCESWINMARIIIEEDIPGASFVDLSRA